MHLGLGLGLTRQGGGAASPYLGLTGDFDYFIDAVAGSDGNAGTSEGAAWASLDNITEDILVAGQTVRVLVKAGTYDKAGDYFRIYNSFAAAPVIEIVCEPGCTWDGAAATAARAPTETSAVDIGGPQQVMARLYGNGLTIQNYNYQVGDASPQAIGVNDDSIIYGYDFYITSCGDGISLHSSATGYFWDVSAEQCFKGPIANVGTSHIEVVRGKFTSMAGAPAGAAIVLMDAATTGAFDECVFLAGAADKDSLKLANATVNNSQLGTATQWVRVNTPVLGSVSISNSYLHVYDDNANIGLIDTCYGLLSFRYRNTMDATIRNSVIVGESTQPTARGIYYINYNAGTGGLMAVESTVFADYNEVDYGFVGRETYLAGTTFDGTSLWNTAVLSATMIANATVTGTITTDPQLGSRTGYDMADYASAALLAGFGPDDVVERAANIPRLLT